MKESRRLLDCVFMGKVTLALTAHRPGGRQGKCMGFRVYTCVSTLTASQHMKNKGRHRYLLYMD